MSKIAIVATGEGDFVTLARVVRQVVPISLDELRRRVQFKSALVEFVLFGNEHEEVARNLRLLVAALERADVGVRLYELEDGESFDDVVQPERLEVSSAMVENILRQHEEERERQRRLGRDGK